MKIDNSTKPVATGAVNGAGGRSGKGGAAAVGSSGSATVQLSPMSSQLQAIGSGMADTPVIDSARVAEIKQAIVDGRFKVNPDAVAEHLLATARELLRSRQN